jgi:hypothetical protein
MATSAQWPSSATPQVLPLYIIRPCGMKESVAPIPAESNPNVPQKNGQIRTTYLNKSNANKNIASGNPTVEPLC